MVTRSFYAIAIAAVIVPGAEPTIKPKDEEEAKRASHVKDNK